MKSYTCLAAAGALFVLGASGVRGHDSVTAMAEAASDFLGALTPEQREKATYEITDAERINWHFIPKPFEGAKKRGGLPLSEMRPDQQHLAHALLSSGLSHRGYIQALQIMSLEQILWEMENDPKRKAEMYYVSVFGEPGSDGWGWRVEGHHLSVNFTIAEGKVVSGTPNFYATNPAEVRDGPRKGLRVLAYEEDIARALVQSLSGEQREKAIVEEKAPRDILTSAKPVVESLGDAGLPHAEFDKGQRETLDALIETYVRRLRPDLADADLAKIDKAGRDGIIFAWAGGIEKNEPHYYRVQGPTFLLEYANTQNGANHVHAVWRDFEGDFGRDILKEHYRNHHAGVVE